MAITIVTSIVGTSAGGTTGVTLNLGSTAQNDIVVTWGGFAGGTATAPGVTSPSGYTSIYTRDAADLDFKVEWKRLGATPDPSVLLAASGDATDAIGYGAYVLRGVDTSANPFDITPNIQTSVATGVPDAPSVLTTTNGAIILALGVNDGFDTSPGVVANFGSDVGGSTNDTDDLSIAGAVSILATAGTLNPSAWSTWASGGYITLTTALKPQAAAPGVPDTQFAFAGAYAPLPAQYRNNQFK